MFGLYLGLGYRVDREEPFMGGTTVYMSKPLGSIDAGTAHDDERSSMNEFVPAPTKLVITIADLEKLDIRVGMIETVELVAGSDKLVKLAVEFGDRRRSVLAGLRKERSDPKAELEGRQALFVVNLAPRRMAGQLSEAMLLDIGYADGITPVLAIPERPIPNGVRAG
jgi:tRNA-binding protein